MVFTTTDRIKRKGVTGGRPAEEIDSAGATVRTWLALIPSASSTVEQTDAVAAGLSGSQVREGLGEPGGVVHLEHDVRGSLGRIGGGSVNLGRGDFPRRRRRAPPRRRRNRRAATTRPGADSRAAPAGRPRSKTNSGRYPRRDAGGVAVGVTAAADAAGLETQAPTGPEPPPGSARVVGSRWRDAGPTGLKTTRASPDVGRTSLTRRPSRSYPACSAAGAKSRARSADRVGDAPSPCSSTNFILLRNGPANWLSPACRSAVCSKRALSPTATSAASNLALARRATWTSGQVPRTRPPSRPSAGRRRPRAPAASCWLEGGRRHDSPDPPPRRGGARRIPRRRRARGRAGRAVSERGPGGGEADGAAVDAAGGAGGPRRGCRPRPTATRSGRRGSRGTSRTGDPGARAADRGARVAQACLVST